MTDFRLAVQGNYQKVIESRKKAVLTGLRLGTKQSSGTTKNDIRSDIRRSGLGNRLAGTVQDSLYPKSGLSFSPVGLVYSKAPKIVSGHADGGTITARAAGAMPIPIQDGPAAKIRLRRGESRIEAFERRFGKLTYIRRPGENPLLVAKMKRTDAGRLVKKRALKPLKKRQGPRVNKGADVTVPVFTLVKNFRAKQRLDSRKIMEKGRRRHPARLAYHLRTHLDRSNRETAIR